jgi:hypothetical protein
VAVDPLAADRLDVADACAAAKLVRSEAISEAFRTMKPRDETRSGPGRKGALFDATGGSNR